MKSHNQSPHCNTQEFDLTSELLRTLPLSVPPLRYFANPTRHGTSVDWASLLDQAWSDSHRDRDFYGYVLSSSRYDTATNRRWVQACMFTDNVPHGYDGAVKLIQYLCHSNGNVFIRLSAQYNRDSPPCIVFLSPTERAVSGFSPPTEPGDRASVILQSYLEQSCRDHSASGLSLSVVLRLAKCYEALHGGWTFVDPLLKYGCCCCTYLHTRRI